jgi:solute carrier family 35 protein F5
MAFAGSLITSLQDASHFQDNDSDVFRHQLWGDAAGLISAVGYGGYTVLVRVLCPEDENRMSMQLFLGYIGLINMILLSPFLLWVIPGLIGTNGLDQNYNQQDQDQSDIPYYPTQQITAFVLFCVVVKGLFDNVLSDYLWARSIILTSATVATVGVGLTIPLALISDVFIMGRADIMSFGNIAGAMLVLLGFVFVNIGEGGDDGDREEPSFLSEVPHMYEVV